MNKIEKLREYKEKQAISYDELARRLKVNVRNVYRWLKEGIEPGQMARRIIQEFLDNSDTL